MGQPGTERGCAGDKGEACRSKLSTSPFDCSNFSMPPSQMALGRLLAPTPAWCHWSTQLVPVGLVALTAALTAINNIQVSCCMMELARGSLHALNALRNFSNVTPHTISITNKTRHVLYFYMIAARSSCISQPCN